MSSFLKMCATKYTRNLSQILFILISIIIGIRFSAYVHFLSVPGMENPPVRPPGVEAYLPISSLMSLIYFVKTGIVQSVRPAGFILFVSFIIISVLMRRGFCSWMCPIGALSELVYKIREKLLGTTVRFHWYVEFELKALKYLLLGFFLFFLLPMAPELLEKFIYGNYNAITDVRMYEFFAHMSGTAFKVILFLFVMSFVLRNFWCRYLCPYGAFLGLTSLISPMAVERNPEKCISCGKCSKVCPNGIFVDKKDRVITTECTGCYMCIEDCPSPGALEMKIAGYKKPITTTIYGIALITIFLLITRGAMAADYWHSSRKIQDVKVIYQNRDDVEHPTMRMPGGGVSVKPYSEDF